jgi:hypothetical protein
MKKILFTIAIVVLMVGIVVGDGIAQDISVSPERQDFGNIVMGNSSSPRLFTITNTGGADLVVRNISLEDINANMFSWTTDTCPSTLPITLSKGTSCAITATFSPTSGGAKSATLKIVSNASGSPAVGVPLTGTGLQPLSVGLVLDKTTYNPGEGINIVLTLQNPGGDIYTSKGFKDKAFELYLIFYDPDGKAILSKLLQDTNPQDPPPPRVFVLPSGELAANLEPVENLAAGWVQSLTIPNALVYYPLSKGGDYSVKAMIPMRTYPDIDYTDANVVPPVDYSWIDHRNSEGALESNNVNFTLIAAPAVPDHITITPSSSTITAGGSQSYKAIGYDQNNNSLGDLTADTSFSISPEGSCTWSSCTAAAAGPHSLSATLNDKIAAAGLDVYGATTITINAPSIVYATNAIVTVTVNSSAGTPGGNVALSVDGGSAVSQPLSSGSTAFTVSAPSAGDHALNATYPAQGFFYGSSGTANLHVILYVYAGFFSPVENPPAVNSANAGQAVPVKWRITDAKGVGISDRGSFVSLTSCKSNCSEWKCIQSATTESAAGAPGLQYLGNGNWHYNWKTPKTYAGTCRIMTIKLKDGTEHKAEFKFK